MHSMEYRNNISFGAISCNKVRIKVFDENAKKFLSKPAFFVKLEASNRDDITAVNFAAETWKGAPYITKIAKASHFMKSDDIDVYALTTQTSGFERLNPNRLIGFAEVRNNCNLPKFNLLYHLQVKPAVMNVDRYGKKTHKYVGSSILHSLKKIYKNITLFSADSPNVEKFYIHNGFVRDAKQPQRFLWSSNIFKKLQIHWNNFLFKFKPHDYQ